jgi:hypothetical protein
MMATTDDAILQLYINCVEMADRVSARRATANSFFLALHTTLAALAAVGTGTSSKLLEDRWAISLVAFVGVVISGAWWMLLRTFRDLNRAKFAVINEIEATHLPIQPFTDEWEVLKKDPVRSWRTRYAEFTTVERVVPCVFAGTYVAVGLRALIG